VSKILIFWRTMIVILILALLLGWGLWLCLRWGANGVAMFPIFCTATAGLGALAVAKSSWEHWTNAKEAAKNGTVPLSEIPKEAPHG
jgi:ethanolamine transporter EutH